MFRNVVKTGMKGSVGFAGGMFGYGFYLYNTDEGTKRAIQFYYTCVPVVLHYRFIEALHTFCDPVSDEEWEKLDKFYAFSTVSKLGELQGMYCKYGQTAAGFTNTFGEAWIREFRKLENEVPPRSIDTIYKTIEEETGKPLKETFSYFDPIPLGSASIGQVHKAKLRSSSSGSNNNNDDEDGLFVACKVQYPEAQQLFQKDMATIRTFCEWFAPEQVVMLEQIEKQNATELDYRNEANNLLRIRNNMIRHGFQPSEVIVPSPVLEHTTRRMLVMEYLRGPKLIDGIRDYFSIWAKEHGTTLHELETKTRETMEREGIPAKYDGPSAASMNWYQNYLRVRDGVQNFGIALYNGTAGWFRPSLKLDYKKTNIPPNIPRIIDTLMRVHGYQLLADGLFNSDPHGGNFLLLRDNTQTTTTTTNNYNNNKIGLIDYGSTKSFTRNERLATCLLYAALARNDKQRLFDMCDIGGYKSKYGNKDVLFQILVFGNDSWGKDVTGGKNIQQFVDELKRQDPWEEIPDNFVMAQLMSIRLRSLALGMNHPIKCSDWWGPIAEEILIKEGLPYDNWDYDMLLKHKPEINIQKYKFG